MSEEKKEAEENQNKKSDPLKVSGMHYGARAEIFDNARKLRMKMTPAEKSLWEYLRKKPLGFKFRRQHPIHKYVLDFYCHKKRLSIEIDGDYHLDEEQQEKDRLRTEVLTGMGIREIRFSNEMVMSEFVEVCRVVEVELDGTPSPTPDP